MKGCRPGACGSLGAGEVAREPQGQGQGRGGVAWGHLEDSEGAAGPAGAGLGPYLGREAAGCRLAT